MRAIADHLKASTFIIKDGVKPSNKGRGYFLRRLLRKSAVKMYLLSGEITPVSRFKKICFQVVEIYGSRYFQVEKDKKIIIKTIEKEMNQFSRALNRGLKKIKKTSRGKINASFAFDLYQSYGFPFQITQEILAERNIKLDKKKFEAQFKKHKKISRQGSKKKFSGGLLDHSQETVKLHTATHLLHRALRIVLGEHVQQRGSNITHKRLRFDFSHFCPLTKEELVKVEKLVNEKINENLSVWSEIMDENKARKIGALGLFNEKYPPKVTVYFIGEKKDKKRTFSQEFCKGPHVNSTGSLKKFKIYKESSAGAGIRRIYAQLISEK